MHLGIPVRVRVEDLGKTSMWRSLRLSRSGLFKGGLAWALVGILLLQTSGAAASSGIRGELAEPAVRPLSDQEDRDSWQQPEKVMDAIGIRAGMTIGEVGAGYGYFTFKLSRRVGPEGKIYANDIDRKALEEIEKQAKREDIGNIITVLGEVERPLFPGASMDLVVMVYVLHDLARPAELLENIKPSLKADAPLVILERDPEKMRGAAGHFYSKDKLLETVEKAGYEVSRIETFLPRDTIYVCQQRPRRP
jgi:predicted methyltransferase